LQGEMVEKVGIRCQGLGIRSFGVLSLGVQRSLCNQGSGIRSFWVRRLGVRGLSFNVTQHRTPARLH
jgi:hypothetical protein